MNLKFIMSEDEILKFICFFVLLMLCSLTSCAKADTEVEAIEKSLYEYHRYVSGFVWKWMTPLLTCDRVGTVFHRTEAYPTMTEVMLESAGCTQIQMEVLACVYKECLHTSRSEEEMIAGSLFSVRGVNGEVYEVEPPGERTQCKDPETPVIKKCIHTGKDMRINFEEIENLFCEKREVITFEKWENRQFFCDLACPEFYSVSAMKVNRETILLKSTRCSQIQMDILKCTCRYVQDPTVVKIVYCAKGVRGEVYKVSKSYLGHVPETFYIRKRIIDFEGKRVRPLCNEKKILGISSSL